MRFLKTSGESEEIQGKDRDEQESSEHQKGKESEDPESDFEEEQLQGKESEDPESDSDEEQLQGKESVGPEYVFYEVEQVSKQSEGPERSHEVESNSSERLEVTESGRDNATPGPSTKAEIGRKVPKAQPVDPALWPDTISQSYRAEAVRRGPLQVRESHVFPKNKDGQAFSHSLLYRKMPNGERVKRSWLSYSEVNVAVFSYSCKLFSTQVMKFITGGLKDWKNIYTILHSHENSSEHISTMQKWRELESRSTTGQTIDQRQMTLLEEER